MRENLALSPPWRRCARTVNRRRESSTVVASVVPLCAERGGSRPSRERRVLARGFAPILARRHLVPPPAPRSPRPSSPVPASSPATPFRPPAPAIEVSRRNVGKKVTEGKGEGGTERVGKERERERKCARSRALSCDVIIACATVIDVRGGIGNEENDVDRDYRG